MNERLRQALIAGCVLGFIIFTVVVIVTAPKR
jgi:hypothetical protein